MRKDVIRIGDTVKIVNPVFFIRCGYPLTLRDGISMIKKDKCALKQLDDAIYAVIGVKPQINDYIGSLSVPPLDHDSKDFNKILKILGFYRISRERFGGSKRNIH